VQSPLPNIYLFRPTAHHSSLLTRQLATGR